VALDGFFLYLAYWDSNKHSDATEDEEWPRLLREISLSIL